MQRVSIAGATLAGLLQSCCASPRPCVGLLFGHVTTAVSTHAQDTADDLQVTQVQGHISASCACVGTHAFYDNTGDISEEQLAVLLSSCCCGSGADTSTDNNSTSRQLLGWFSYRPHTPCVPSMLEAAVSLKLQAVLASSDATTAASQQQQQQPALVFGLITSNMEHSGATVSLQHRFFATHPDSSWQVLAGASNSSSSGFAASFGGSSSSRGRTSAPQHPNLQPLDLQVLNLGQLGAMSMQRQPATAADAAAASSSGWFSSSTTSQHPNSGGSGRQGIQQLSALAAALEGCRASQQQQQPQKQLLAAAQAVSAAGGQLAVVEGLYSSLLQELSRAADAVSERQDALLALQEENARLRARVQLAGGGGAVVPAAASKDLLL